MWSSDITDGQAKINFSFEKFWNNFTCELVYS